MDYGRIQARYILNTEMSLFLIKSKSLPNSQISWCIVNSAGVVEHAVVVLLVVFPSETLMLLSGESRVDLEPFTRVERCSA